MDIFLVLYETRDDPPMRYLSPDFSETEGQSALGFDIFNHTNI